MIIRNKKNINFKLNYKDDHELLLNHILKNKNKTI